MSKELINPIKKIEEETKQDARKELVEEIISTIDREIDNSLSAIYKCDDGTEISTDVGYVYDWFKEYKEKLREKHCK